MDNTLQELRAHIKASGFESPSPKHAVIPAYIETNILKDSGSPIKDRVPPLDIVIYTIRWLLALSNSPGMSDVPDLLDLVTTIEFYRELGLRKADEALRIHQANDDDATKLTDEEVKHLRAHQTNDSALRNMYIKVDIYHLRTSDPPRPADLALRLCEYFPDKNTRAESPRLIHHNLSNQECEAVRLCGGNSRKFVSDSYEWAGVHQITGQTLASVFQTPEFAIAFPCEIHPTTLRKTVEFYMDTVERMVNELQAMFPQN
ncbi:hypothetical protein DFH09DRAFT_1353151 [Mycena vulgaris]|nr:hypothetical protein DFH09DRAFT_1353151 [Mycena vulgaris]